jgi:hypothetical protein
VISRATAKGPAVTFKFSSVTEADGTRQIIIIKAAYDKKTDEITENVRPFPWLPSTRNVRCSLSIAPSVYGEFYKIDADEMWQKVGATRELNEMNLTSYVLAPTKLIFGNDCGASRPSILEAEKNWSTSIDTGLGRLSKERNLEALMRSD